VTIKIGISKKIVVVECDDGRHSMCCGAKNRNWFGGEENGTNWAGEAICG
jgi:hypothetical protein